MHFLLDSGAQVSVMNSSTAKHLGMRGGRVVSVMGVGKVTAGLWPQIWEQRAFGRQGFENLCDLLTKVDQRRYNDTSRQFLSVVADRAITPVDVLGREECYIGLASAQVPAELVKQQTLLVMRLIAPGPLVAACCSGFALNDTLVLFKADGALGRVHDLRPLPLGNDRFQEPIHIEREVVNPPQINVCGHCPFELLNVRTAFDHGFRTDEVVLVYCLNDISELIPEWTNAQQTVRGQWADRPWVVQNSFLLDTLYQRLSLGRNPYFGGYFNFVMEAYTGPLFDVQKKRLLEMRDLARSHSAGFCVVIFPFLNTLGPQYPYIQAHERLSDAFGAENIPCLDLLPIYRDFPSTKVTVNRHDAHPNEFAHTLASEAIEKFLMPLMATNPPTLAR